MSKKNKSNIDIELAQAILVKNGFEETSVPVGFGDRFFIHKFEKIEENREKNECN